MKTRVTLQQWVCLYCRTTLNKSWADFYDDDFMAASNWTREINHILVCPDCGKPLIKNYIGQATGGGIPIEKHINIGGTLIVWEELPL